MAKSQPQVAEQPGPAANTSSVDSAVVSDVDEENAQLQTGSGRRYLAGRDSLRSGIGGRGVGTWILLTFVGLVLVLVTLATVVSWSVIDDPRGLLVSSIIVESYHGSRLPPPMFAAHDAARLQATGVDTQSPAEIQRAAERHDFERHISTAVSGSDPKVRVVYIKAYATGDGERAWLIPANGSPERQSHGFDVDGLLDALEHGTARRVVVLIDTGEFVRSLGSGLTENPFAGRLRERFAARAKTWKSSPAWTDRQLLVLTASDSEQPAWASPQLSGSAFGAACAYCLRGGPLADQRGPQESGDASPDGAVSLAELVAFVSNVTESWSRKNRSVTQRPQALWWPSRSQAGDVIVSDVRPELTMADVLELPSASPESPSPDGSSSDTPTPKSNSDASETDGADAAPPESDATPDASQSSTELSSPDDQTDDGEQDAEGEQSAPMAELLEQFHGLVEDHDRLRQRRAWAFRPAVFLACQQKIVACQSAILAGNMRLSRELLDVVIPELHAELEASVTSTSVPEPVADVVSPEALDSALAKPAPETLRNLSQTAPRAAGTLLMLTRRFRDGDEWCDAELAKIAARSAAAIDAVLRLQLPPETDAVVLQRLKNVEAKRQAGLIDLVGGHFDSARHLLKQALSDAAALRSDMSKLQQQFDAIELMLLELPPVLAVIDELPAPALVTAFDEFLHTVPLYAADPFQHAGPLSSLESSIRFALQSEAAGALESVRWERSRTLLRFPFLAPELRVALLRSLVTIDDSRSLLPNSVAPETADGPSRNAPSQPERPYEEVIPYVEMLIRLSGVDDSETTDIPQLLQRLLSGSLPATGSILSRLRNLERGPAQSDDATRDWLVRQSVLVNASAWWASFTEARFHSHDRLAARISEALARRNAAEHEAQLQHAKRLLPAEAFLFLDANRQRSIRLPVEPYVRLLSPQRVVLVRNTEAEITLSLKVQRTLPAGTELVLDWRTNNGGRLVTFGDDGEPGQIRWKLDQPPGLGGRKYEFKVPTSVHDQPDADTPERTQFQVSSLKLALPDGSYEWLPWHVDVSPVPLPPAEIVVDWPDDGAHIGYVDLLPGQSVPIQLLVHRSDQSLDDLSVRFRGAARSETVTVGPWKPETMTLPIPAPEALSLLFDENRLRLELFAGKQLIDSKVINVHVLDVRQCFRERAVFDPTSRRFSVVLDRVHRSDVPGAVAFQLEDLTHFPPDGADRSFVSGNQSAVLKNEEWQVSLGAVLPLTMPLPASIGVSISGVPRAFRYRIQYEGQLVRPSALVRLAFAEPTDGIRWVRSPGVIQAPVQVMIDASGRTQLDVGVDLDGNGRLSAIERQFRREVSNGRIASVDLATEKDQWLVRSQVSDITVPLTLNGLRGPQVFLAEVRPLTPDAPKEPRRAAVSVFLLDASPPVRVVSPPTGSTVAADAPLLVTVAGNATSPALDSIQIVRDLNDNGRVDKDEPGAVVNRKQILSSPAARWTVELPDTATAIGPGALLVQTTASALPLTPAADVEAKPEPVTFVGKAIPHSVAFTATGAVSGLIQTADGRPVANASVRLEGLSQVFTTEDGKFEFSAVPAGAWRLVASSRTRASETTVHVTSGKTEVNKITLYIR